MADHNHRNAHLGLAEAEKNETQKVVGGLFGRTSLGLLRVELFFLPENLRRDRLGSHILAMAEEEGRRRGCTRAVLSTVHSFRRRVFI